MQTATAIATRRKIAIEGSESLHTFALEIARTKEIFEILKHKINVVGHGEIQQIFYS
jgi:hypothetical protein